MKLVVTFLLIAISTSYSICQTVHSNKRVNTTQTIEKNTVEIVEDTIAVNHSGARDMKIQNAPLTKENPQVEPKKSTKNSMKRE